ncbi:MAG TPA: lysophospholipid acyltransferase family protein [Polyangium sp.]|nr:lysophospholipid acyltransferase family protein [Polyangium sp.]
MSPTIPPGYALAHTTVVRRLARKIERHFQAKLHGTEHLPASGGALLVGNHAYVGVDSWILSALLISECDLVPRFLGDRNLWRIPVVKQFLTSFGAIPGQPDDAIELLRAKYKVIVYPGGIDDSFKLSSQAYTLQWNKRAGFARVAMRAQVPIIPVAATGIDELFQLEERESLLGRMFAGSSRYDIPIPTSLNPARVPLDYYLLPPIDTAGDPANDADVERVRSATENAIRHVLDAYRERLEQRSG